MKLNEIARFMNEGFLNVKTTKTVRLKSGAKAILTAEFKSYSRESWLKLQSNTLETTAVNFSHVLDAKDVQVKALNILAKKVAGMNDGSEANDHIAANFRRNFEKELHEWMDQYLEDLKDLKD